MKREGITKQRKKASKEETRWSRVEERTVKE